MKQAVRTRNSPIVYNRKKSAYNFYKLASILLFVIAVYFLTAFYNRDFFIWAEELSLFVSSRLFFVQRMGTPGGLLGYMGAFFTQFFYYPFLGSTITVLLLLPVPFLVSRAFKVPARYFPLAFVPAVMLLISMTNIEYAFFTLKSPGYLFSNTIGVITCLSGVILYQKIKTWHKRLAAILLLIVLGYPLFGFYALFTVLLSVVYEIIGFIKHKQAYRFAIIVPALVGAVAVPYLFYLYLYDQVQLRHIFTTGLPGFSLKDEFRLLVPFFIIFLSFAAFLVLPLKERKTQGKGRLSSIMPLTFLSVVLIISLVYSRHDRIFKAELKMTRAIEENNWEKVIEEGTLAGERATMLINMYHHLALYKLGLAGDRMFIVDNAPGLPVSTSSEPMMIMHVGAKPVYFQYGKVNFCYRWCMEDMVEYGMNIQGLKYMVKCAIVNGEFALAQKYTNVLAKTLFHKKWAGKYQDYINDHSLVLKDPELMALRPLMAYDNILDGDGNRLDIYIRNSFAYMRGGPPEIVELSLQCNLLLKNIERFWPRFFLYARTHDNIPVHYQEAALLYSYLENKADISKVKFDEKIIDRFNQLIAMSQKYAHKPDEYNRKIFKPIFGDTFWYYYFFVKEQGN